MEEFLQIIQNFGTKAEEYNDAKNKFVEQSESIDVTIKDITKEMEEAKKRETSFNTGA